MVVDFHTHIFSNKIAKSTLEHLSSLAHIPYYADGTVDGLVESMAKSGVDLSVTFPVLTKPEQFERVNTFCAWVNDTYQNVISFAGIHPTCEDLPAKMREVKAMGFKGVKIHPDYQGTFFDDERYVAILQLARELDLVVITHAGFDVGFPDQPIRCTPDRVLNALNQAKGVKLVLAHMGGFKLDEEVFEKLAGLDVYIDTSLTMHNMTKQAFHNFVAKHGADKLLFATDSPWSDQQMEIEALKSMGLPKEDEDKIFYQNAIKLLGIEK